MADEMVDCAAMVPNRENNGTLEWTVMTVVDHGMNATGHDWKYAEYGHRIGGKLLPVIQETVDHNGNLSIYIPHNTDDPHDALGLANE